VLDAIIVRYMENDEPKASLVADGLRCGCGAGHAADPINEYKRRQAPVGIRVSPRSFGKDWRYPSPTNSAPEARGRTANFTIWRTP
jgi:NAD+ synthase (glutamine-hydrolysing)